MITTLWIAIAILLMVALVIIWWPHVRQDKRPPVNDSSRTETNTQIYRAGLEKLQRQLNEELIDQQEFASLKSELDHKLLQDEEAARRQLEIKPKSIGWPLTFSLIIIAICISLYYRIGAYHKLDQSHGTPPHGPMSEAQLMRAQVQQLEQQVQTKPENSEAWFSLGHTYTSVGEFDKAIVAFDKVIAIEGQRAEFIGPQAQALYYKNQQQITPSVQAKIDQALALDPYDVSTLVLLGMDSYLNAHYAKAIEYWQLVLTSNRPNIDRNALTTAINDAKQQLMAAGKPIPETPTPPVPEPATGLTVTLSIDPSLTGSVTPDQVVFIYAVPIEGPRMPLAAAKLTAGELPTQVVLSDALAMTPEMKLSSVDRVHIFGVISQSGNAGIRPGDLKGILRDVSIRQENPIALIINEKVITEP